MRTTGPLPSGGRSRRRSQPAARTDLPADVPPDEVFPGAHARSPGQIPRRGWAQVVRRAVRRSGQDRVPLLSAGIAFFGYLALFPSVVAAGLVYGLVAEPSTVVRHLGALAQVLPAEGASLVARQLDTLNTQPRTGVSLGLVAAVLAAVWAVSVGVHHLIGAVDMAYEETTTRGLLRRRLTALGLTLGVAVTFALMVALVAVFPLVVDTTGVPGILLQVGRWAALAVLTTAVLGVLYRRAPDRRPARRRWVSVGAVVATALWLAVSVGFSLYVSTVGQLAPTYGTIGGVAVLLVWMWLSTMAVLLGAEINAEAEHQTDADTTVGPDLPRGRRGAVKADTAVGRPDPGTSTGPAP